MFRVIRKPKNRPGRMYATGKRFKTRQAAEQFAASIPFELDPLVLPEGHSIIRGFHKTLENTNETDD